MTVQTLEELLAEREREELLAELRAQPWMTTRELLDEAFWLIEGGVAPHMAAATLGVRFDTLVTFVRRYHRDDLARLIALNDRFNTWNLRSWGFAEDRNMPGNAPRSPVHATTAADRPTTHTPISQPVTEPERTHE